MVLKPNMAIAGQEELRSRPPLPKSPKKTCKLLKSCVPTAVPGIAFLSGGQTRRRRHRPSRCDAQARCPAVEASPSPTVAHCRPRRREAWSRTRSRTSPPAQRRSASCRDERRLASKGEWKAELEEEGGVSAKSKSASKATFLPLGAATLPRDAGGRPILGPRWPCCPACSTAAIRRRPGPPGADRRTHHDRTRQAPGAADPAPTWRSCSMANPCWMAMSASSTRAGADGAHLTRLEAMQEALPTVQAGAHRGRRAASAPATTAMLAGETADLCAVRRAGH